MHNKINVYDEKNLATCYQHFNLAIKCPLAYFRNGTSKTLSQHLEVSVLKVPFFVVLFLYLRQKINI